MTTLTERDAELLAAGQARKMPVSGAGGGATTALGSAGVTGTGTAFGGTGTRKEKLLATAFGRCAGIHLSAWA